MATTRKEIVGAVVLVVVFFTIIIALYVMLRPSGPAVGYEDNFFVQQSVRIQDQNKSK